MRVTITNISSKIISTDVGLLNPGDSKSLDMSPDAAYKAAEGLSDLRAGGLVTISVAAEANKDDALEPASVSTASVADGAVTAAKLGALAVTTAKINTSAVTTAKIAALAVDNTLLAAGAVTAGKIAAGGVSAANQFAAGVVDATALASNAVTTAKVAALAVTAAKINMSVSTEQTGTGSSQNVAHGLTGTPSIVLAILTDVLAAETVVTYGSHTSSNSVLTVTSGAKFKVLAII